MKTVSLCGGEGKCPQVTVKDDEVIIGEEGNLCRLKRGEWETLRDKIKQGEL